VTGAGFAFTEAVGFAAPIDDPVLLDAQTAFTFGNGPSYLSPMMDVRAFNSFAIKAEATGGTMLVTDLWAMEINFYADNSGAAAANVFADQFLMYPSGFANGGFLRWTDQMHGSWMQIAVSDPLSVGRTLNLAYRVYGSYRPMSNAYLRASNNGQLYSTARVLGAGANDGGAPCQLGHGLAQATMLSGAGGGATMDIRIGGSTVTENRYQLVAGAANVRVTQQFILTKQQPFVLITNNGGAVSTIRSSIYLQVQPY